MLIYIKKLIFEKIAPSPQKRTRFDLYKNVDADYYGYRDEEDGTLLEYEREIENKGMKFIILCHRLDYDMYFFFFIN